MDPLDQSVPKKPKRDPSTRRTQKARTGTRRSQGGPNKQAGEKGPNMGGTSCKPFTLERKQAYCAEIAQHGQRQKAADAVLINYQTAAKHLRDDKVFLQMFEEALRKYREALVSEMKRRGVDGVERKVFYRDVHIDTVKEYSDNLLTKLVNRYCPEFRDQTKVENTNLNVDFGAADIQQLTTEQRAKLRDFVNTPTDNPTPIPTDDNEQLPE